MAHGVRRESDPVAGTIVPVSSKKNDTIPNVTPRLRTVLEGVPDYALVLDAKGRTQRGSCAFVP